MIETWGLIPLLIEQGFVGIGVWLLGEIQPGNVVWPAEAFGHEDGKSKRKLGRGTDEDDLNSRARRNRWRTRGLR